MRSRRALPLVCLAVCATVAVWTMLGRGTVVHAAQEAGVATAAGSVPAPAPPPGPSPTPLEQAVMEHNCRVPGQAMATREAYETCLALQLTALREEFGVDVKKLSAAERRTIDKACSALRIERGRDAYVACLSERLLALIVARGHQPPSRIAAASAGAPVTPELAVPPPLEPVAPAAPEGSGVWRLLLIGFVVIGGAAAGAWMLSNRHRQPSVVLCRQCGEVAQSGDLCASCRHELAESQRRAAAERAGQQQAIVDAAQRASEQPAAETAAPPQVPLAPLVPLVPMSAPTPTPAAPANFLAVQAAAQAAADAQESARREREAQAEAVAEREREAARRREADRRRWEEAAAAVITEEAEPDAWQVLGLAADATTEAIQTAYETAAKKYAPEQVSHLGAELQEHYRKKAAAVERAYAQLTASPAATAPHA